jgi:hypothetical protein
VPGPGAYAPPEACVASQTLSARELLAWTYPRGAGRSLHDRRNCYRSSDGRPRGCASGLVDGLHGLAARCGNWPIRALKRWAQTWARIAAAEIVIWVQWRVADVSATRPLLIYLAGVLFPEGAVAGGRRSPLSFHSITSSARASQGRPNFEAESACGLEIDHQQELGGKGDRQLGRFGPPLESYRCTPRSGEQARHSPNRTTSALRAEAQAESRSMQATRR